MSKKNIRRILGRIFDGQFIAPHEIPLAFERAHLQKLFSLLKVDAVFDVGANRGQYAQMLREIVGFDGTIISYEPNPGCAEVLRATAETDPRWFIEEAAIDVTEGLRNFNVFHSDEFSSFHDPSEIGKTRFQSHVTLESRVQVRTTTLEFELEKYKRGQNIFRPFLKMDTQGHDLNAAKSARTRLQEFVGLLSELSFTALYGDAESYSVVIEYYREMGFSLSAFVPNNLGHFPRLYEMDCIMFNEKYVARE